MSEQKEVCQKLVSWLALRSRPIAVRMLRSVDEIPANAIQPKRDLGHHLSLCQALSHARRQGETIAMLLQDHWCVEPVIGLGYGEPPEYFLSGANRYPASASSLEAGKRWADNLPKFEPGKYAGVLCGPWESAEFEPDVIILYVDPAQLTHLMISVNWIDGSDVYSQLSGHSACVYAIVPPMLKHDFYVAVPCIGDRKRAAAQDNELIFSFPPDKAQALLDGLCTTASSQVGFPILHDVAPEYPLAPAYKKIGELMGIEY
ncbi:MAG: DUF169 domain-containing protein [Lawsonibacter sp.]|jgi:uncharacterized protein (DUF169 family)